MIIVVENFLWVDADIESAWSLLFANWTPGFLTSMASLPRAHWSRGWYLRPHPCNKGHHWSWFCCDSFFSWIVLKSFRHCFRAHCRTEMADIEQAQHMIQHITCEIPFCSDVCGLVCGVDVFDLDLGIQINSIKQPLSATLWVLETRLIVGLLPLMIILITASLSSNTYKSFLMRRLDVRGNTINFILRVGLPSRSLTSLNDNGSPQSLCSLSHVSKDRNNKIPQLESRKPV